MARMKMIQIQGSVIQPIGKITNDARTIVSKICLGVDDIQLLGNKALVLRAEIYPKKLPMLYAALDSIGIKFNEESLPDIETLKEDIEYPLSIQVISFSGDTDRRVNVPKIPG